MQRNPKDKAEKKMFCHSYCRDKCLFFLQVIAENLSEEEIMGLKEMFKSMDTDNNGTITFEELKAGLPKLGTKLSESEVRQLMDAVQYILFCSLCRLSLMVPSCSFLFYSSTQSN
jgi:hypothetical protein